ncbi:MAG: 50S ribosomal protein L25 [Verrucomicrobia bacterium]|nr:50S ribosomal protein L25 [Verrucomicrobiota bacterium]
MKSLKLKVAPRTQTRRKGSKVLRSAGLIPANIYGKSVAPQNVEIDSDAFIELINSAHSEIVLVDLEVSGDSKIRLALVQDVQHHPLSGEVLHVDFHEVKDDEMITIRIPVESTGEAEGVKSSGGTLEHVIQKLRVTALPKDLPDQILVDVSALVVGQAIQIGQIQAPAGVTILGDKHLRVFAVAAPTVEVEAAPAAAGESKQPEMIKEKKEEAPAPAKKK